VDLNIGSMPITDQSVSYLARLKSLKTLSIAHNALLGSCIPHLAETNIEDINLDGTAIRDSDLLYLARARHLTHLSLNRTAISDQGLATIETMNHLRSISITDTPAISGDAVMRLKRKRPEMEIRRVAQNEHVRNVLTDMGFGVDQVDRLSAH
jgi:Leucine Rich repeat